MKKAIGACVVLIIVLFASFTAAVIYSFTSIKPSTEEINKSLAKKFSQVIYIPNGIASPTQTFDETSYSWEMETPQKEIIGVILKHNTAYSRNQQKITLILEMPQGGDPSIFTKVLPAVIKDKQSLESALNPQKANLSANSTVGYENIKLSILPQTNQTVQVTWEFEKSKLEDDLASNYKRLSRLPESQLKFLYSLPHTILGLLST